MPIIKITCFEPSCAMISRKRMTASNNLSVKVRSPLKADTVKITRLRSGLFAPVLGPLLQSRWIIVLLAAVSSALVALTAMGITAWQCPVRSTLGVVCPGCGLTRAMVLLIQGNWRASFDLHAFAPIFLGIGIILAIGSVLPTRLQQMAAYQIANFERRTGIVALLGFSFMLYWFLRIFNLI
jgi:hypothetical protein